MPQAHAVQDKGRQRALPAWLSTGLVLTLALVAFLGTDQWFTILDDETSIVTSARAPVSATVGAFWNGQGQHEHPPLTDLLLHWWLPLGGAAQWSLRLPSICFYLMGLLVLALAARRVGGPAAFAALFAVGLLWPFGFHFGRLAGWYSACFFLVAWLTLAYLRYLETPNAVRLATFVFVSVCLVYSNYYGWCIISCLLIDAFTSRRQKDGRKLLLTTFGTLVVAYTPFWIVFLKEVLGGTDLANKPSLVSKVLNTVYNLYSLFVSESVAPWFWYLSIPAAICMVVSIYWTVALLSNVRRWLVYFAALFGGMAVLGIISTKRLLFISDWLLLAFAIALSSPGTKAARTWLTLALAIVSAIGWGGIVSRKYYAAPHFIEPWAEIADQAALTLRDGTPIVTNNASFLFDLHYSLQKLGMISGSSPPGLAEYPGVVRVEAWDKSAYPGLRMVLFVKGVNTGVIDQTEQVEGWLHSHCAPGGEQTLVPDSGAALKARFFTAKNQQQPPFRISLQRFDCTVPGSGFGRLQ